MVILIKRPLVFYYFRKSLKKQTKIATHTKKENFCYLFKKGNFMKICVFILMNNEVNK